MGEKSIDNGFKDLENPKENIGNYNPSNLFAHAFYTSTSGLDTECNLYPTQ